MDTHATLPLLKTEILPIQVNVIGSSAASHHQKTNNKNHTNNIMKQQPGSARTKGRGGLLRDYTKTRDDHYGKSPVKIGQVRDLYHPNNNKLLDSFLTGISGGGGGANSRGSGSSSHTAPTLPMTDDSDSTANSAASGGCGYSMLDLSGDSLGSTSTNNYLPSLLKQPKKTRNTLPEPTLFLEQRRVSQHRVSTVLERVEGFDMMDMSSSTVGSEYGGDHDDSEEDVSDNHEYHEDDELLFPSSSSAAAAAAKAAAEAITMEDESMTYSELCGPHTRVNHHETASESDSESESSSGYSFGGEEDDDDDDEEEDEHSEDREASLNLSSLMRGSSTSFASASTSTSGKSQKNSSSSHNHQKQLQNNIYSAAGGSTGRIYNQTTVRSAGKSLLDTAVARTSSSSSCHVRRNLKENSSLNSLLDSAVVARSSSSCHVRRQKENSSLNSLLDSATTASRAASSSICHVRRQKDNNYYSSNSLGGGASKKKSTSLHTPRTRSSSISKGRSLHSRSALGDSSNKNNGGTHERRRQQQPRENNSNLSLNKSASLHTPRTNSLLGSLDSMKMNRDHTTTNNKSSGSSHERRRRLPASTNTAATANGSFRSMQLPSRTRASSTGTSNIRRTRTIPSCSSSSSSSSTTAIGIDRRSQLLASTRGIQSMSNLNSKEVSRGGDNRRLRQQVPQVSFRIRKKLGRSATFDASTSQHDRWNESLRGLQRFDDGSDHAKKKEGGGGGGDESSKSSRRGNNGLGLRRAKTFDDRIGSMSFRRIQHGLKSKDLPNDDDDDEDDNGSLAQTTNTTGKGGKDHQDHQNSNNDMKRHSIHGTISSSCGRPTSLLCPQEHLNRSLRNLMVMEERERLQCSWGTQMAKMGTLSSAVGSGGGSGGMAAVASGAGSNMSIETALSAVAVGANAKCRSQFMPPSAPGRLSFATETKSGSNLHKSASHHHFGSSNVADENSKNSTRLPSGAGGRTSQLISFGQQNSSMRSVRSSFSGGTAGTMDLDSSCHEFTRTRIRRITTNVSDNAAFSSSKDPKQNHHKHRQSRRSSMSVISFGSKSNILG